MSRSRRTLRLTLAVPCLALSLVVGAASCSGGDEPADGDGGEVTTTSEAPVTTAPPGVPFGAVETGFGELETGQCFETMDDPTVAELAVWTVGCDTPHTYEIYDQLEYDGEVDGGRYPGTAAVQDWSETACHDRFEAFVGKRWTVSELEIQLWWPTEESWGRGDDTVICAVLEESGDKVTGTLRGAER